jgi:hypothetical protein
MNSVATPLAAQQGDQAEPGAKSPILSLTLSPLQAARLKPFLAVAQAESNTRGILATVCPRHDVITDQTVLELQIGTFSRQTVAKIQKLIRQEMGP